MFDLQDAVEFYKYIDSKTYYDRFIKENIRPDGRNLKEVRKILIEKGVLCNAEGSAKVNLGNTSFICGVTYLVNNVNSLNTNIQNNFILNVEIPSISSSEYIEQTDLIKKATSLKQFLKHTLDSDIIDKEELVIEDNVSNICLVCNILCLSDDGNIFDASLLALIAALEDTRLPQLKLLEVEICGQRTKKEVVQVGHDKPCSLVFIHRPISTTIGKFGEHLIIDPSYEELSLMDSLVTIVVSQDSSILVIYKFRGSNISFQELDKCIDIAIQRFH